MATNATKGKQRVTLELLPKSLDCLGAYAEQRNVSRGSTIDNLIELFLGIDSKVALQLQQECTKQISTLMTELESTHNDFERRSTEKLIAEYKRIADHLAPLAAQLAPQDNSLALAGLRKINLADGHSELIPNDMQIINPENACDCNHIYIAWFMDPENPKDQTQAWQGETLGGPFGYFSTRNDLHLFGKNQTPTFRNQAEHDACAAEAMKLFRFLVGCTASVFTAYPDIQNLCYAWALTSTVGNRIADIGIGLTISRG